MGKRGKERKRDNAREQGELGKRGVREEERYCRGTGGMRKRGKRGKRDNLKEEMGELGDRRQTREW
jgi:hypothetical protein